MAKKRQPNQTIQIGERDGQLSSPGGPLANYFMRNIPLWNPPAWQEADAWRKFVEKQPIAAICRDTIANYLNSLDWAIVARDSEKQDELKPRIKYYTKLLERGNAYYYDIDFASHIEWIIKDLFTLPFGTASEIGRLDDDPSGKVVWIRPIDGGTLAPTLNFDFPLVQVAPNTGLNPVYLPRQFVSRIFLSPRTEIRREGWGYAPPERIWRAIEMMYAGDNYYAQLLLNTPEAGILDLGDLDETSATEWVKSLRDLLYGVNPLKIPVLYGHEKPATWIPFGKPPSEIMYDSVTMRYAAILTAGYGLTLSDIGFPASSNGGDTLAGTIRMERVGNSSGKAIAKKKTEAYWNRILPDSLKFTWIDYDDERNVSRGRARLASAQASQLWIAGKIFKPSEIRRQNIADGLFSIPVPEKIDPNDPEFPIEQSAFGGGGSKPKSLGNPVNPSQGGQGEKIPQQTIQRNATSIEVGVARAATQANAVLPALLKRVLGNLSQDEMSLWEEYVDGYLTGKSDIEEAELKNVIDDICDRTKNMIAEQSWLKEFSKQITENLVSQVLTDRRLRAFYEMEEKAEAKFISGETDDIVVEDVPPDPFEPSGILHSVILASLIDAVSKYAVLVSKSVLLNGNLDVDATDAVDNNIRISREVGKEVLRNIPTIINAVYENGRKHLETIGEKDAIS